jgi:hypothetical protein
MNIINKIKDFVTYSDEEEFQAETQHEIKTKFVFPASFGKFIRKEVGETFSFTPKRTYYYYFNSKHFNLFYTNDSLDVVETATTLEVHLHRRSRTMANDIERWGKSVYKELGIEDSRILVENKSEEKIIADYKNKIFSSLHPFVLVGKNIIQSAGKNVMQLFSKEKKTKSTKRKRRNFRK